MNPQKKFTYKAIILTVIITIVVIFALIIIWGLVSVLSNENNVVSQNTPSYAPVVPVIQQASSTVAMTWHTVKTFTSSENVNTPPFTMNGAEWRINYSCIQSGDDSQNVSGFTSTVGPTSGGGNVTGDVGSDNCPFSDTFYVYGQTPGQYYLTIEPTNAEVTETIQDYY